MCPTNHRRYWQAPCMMFPALQCYLSLARETRSARLQEVLAQTEECLTTFAKRLGLAHLMEPTEEEKRQGDSSMQHTYSHAFAAHTRMSMLLSGPMCGHLLTPYTLHKLVVQIMGRCILHYWDTKVSTLQWSYCVPCRCISQSRS